jgi:hypothetical protein
MTKLSEITAQFKNTKIRYYGMETSVKIQKQLFKMGFRWGNTTSGQGREINFLCSPGWIFIDSDLRLAWAGVEYSGKSSSNYEIFHKTLDKEVEKFLIEKKDAIKQKRFDKLANTKFFIGNNKVLFKKVLDHLYLLGFLWQSGGVGNYDYDCEWLHIHCNGKLGFLEPGDTGRWPENLEEYRTGSLQELSINKKFWPGNKVMTTKKGSTMYAMKKFKVENVQESEAVQEALYKLGYVWKFKIKSLYESLSDVYPALIFCHNNKTLTCSGLDWSDAEALAYKEVAIEELLPEQAFAPAIIEEVIEYPIGRQDATLPAKISLEQMFEKMFADGDAAAVGIDCVPGSAYTGLDTNPKQLVGNLNLPMSGVSPLFKSMVSLGKLNGSLKYGKSNYLGTKVTLSTYLDAIERHMDRIKLGEWFDLVDNVPHLGAIGANCDIIASAQAAGTLINDLGLATGQIEAMLKLVPTVKSLQELHKDRNPNHLYMCGK